MAISAYDGNGVTSDYNKTISYSLSGSNTVISTAANMTSGHIRYSSSTRNDKATITLSGISPYGAKKLSLSFDAYINNTLRVSGTSSVGRSTPKAISSGSNEYEVQIDESAENIAVVFTITHANLSSTGTLGIDNVKLTVVE